MSDIDTSREAVERLASQCESWDANVGRKTRKLIPELLRALLTRAEAAEHQRDALRAQMAWQPIEDQPEWDHRPIRQIIRAEGFKEHSGSCWHRVWVDVAYIERDAPLGYRASDLERIRKDGDMDFIERITHWKPAIFGRLPNAPEAP